MPSDFLTAAIEFDREDTGLRVVVSPGPGQANGLQNFKLSAVEIGSPVRDLFCA